MRITYSSARKINEDLIAFGERFSDARAFFRAVSSPSRRLSFESQLSGRITVDRDRAMCALAIKAIRTAKAVQALCDLNLGDDALALSRVLLENGVVMSWCQRGDGTTRLDTFCLGVAPAKNRWAALLEKYYGDQDDMREVVERFKNSDAQTISREIFKDAHTTWAFFENANGKLAPVTTKQMFLEAGSSPVEESFSYDVPYFEASSYVHSGPQSIRAIADALAGSTYFTTTIPEPSTQTRDHAMRLASVGLGLALGSLNEYASLGFDAEIDEFLRRMRGEETPEELPAPPI